ncbi:MAG TPA: double-strand break repair protein AddB, partial [Sphingomicrobium sp.]|nr:double-strand break repair protein AddB [Sphingomicrobium sp.]
TEAFVRASGGGLVLPRLIAIGDPDLDDRIGGALDPADAGDPVPPAIEPLARQLAIAALVRGHGEGAAEALRLAGDLVRTLDALVVEEVPPSRLKDVGAADHDLAGHWQVSLARLQAIIEQWPAELRRRGLIDLAERRNRLLRATAKRWSNQPPPGFTVAAGITTAAPAVAALLGAVARMPEGMVVLPGLALADVMPDDEWEALSPGEGGQSEQTHPQYHLKLLLDRLGVAREEVEVWKGRGRAASPAARGRAVANAMTAARFSDKWNRLQPAERRLTGIRAVELPDAAAEASAIALALREALETPGRTAALVTPDRTLASRVAALLARWGIHADDSAGRPLSQMPAGTLLLAIAAAASEQFAPVALLNLLKHPLVGGEGEARLQWLDSVRAIDLALRGPRPAPGLAGLDRHCAVKDRERGTRGCIAAWTALREKLKPLEASLNATLSVQSLAGALRETAATLSGGRAWSGPDGRTAAELIAELEEAGDASALLLEPEEWVPVLRQLMEARPVRPPFGGHPRVFIWGLLEARLQKADLIILGGLNEGVWPALPTPDPWLAPKVRAELGLPGLEHRIGLAAHDFASALGAPKVLVTRSRRDSRSPTVASRFWLRLEAMTGGLPRDHRLERLARALDDPGPPQPVTRPEPCPPPEQRPERISVTAVDRLKADPFAFYAQAILELRSLEPVDADHTAAWKGTAVHQVLQEWLEHDECDPDRLRPLAEQLLADGTIHPMLRALWAPRLLEAIDWIAELERANQAEGRRPLRAEASGETPLAGILVYGRADRLDRLRDGGLAVIDYKTGAPPTQKAVDAGFALQLGLLGLIGRAGGFDQVRGDPQAFEYWSLQRHKGTFGRLTRPDRDMAPGEFLDHAYKNFAEAAGRWLTGSEPFTAKLNPAYAPYGDYDQLMRLEEWYGRK